MTDLTNQYGVSSEPIDSFSKRNDYTANCKYPQNLETSKRDKNTVQKQRQKSRSKSKIQDKEKFLETEHSNISLNYHIKFDNNNK
jgi:hypothetical protein